VEVKGSKSDKRNELNPKSKVSAAVINREIQILEQGILPPLGANDRALPRYSTRDANEMSLFHNAKVGNSYPVTSSFKEVLDADNKKSASSRSTTVCKSKTQESVQNFKDSSESVNAMVNTLARSMNDRDDARKQQQTEMLELRRSEMEHKKAEFELRSRIAKRKVTLDFQNAQIAMLKQQKVDAFNEMIEFKKNQDMEAYNNAKKVYDQCSLLNLQFMTHVINQSMQSSTILSFDSSNISPDMKSSKKRKLDHNEMIHISSSDSEPSTPGQAK
jgi:hypothetical protein